MFPLDYPAPIGPWPRVKRDRPVRQITPRELRAWTTYEDEDLYVVNKPGDAVCHPSKEGPWSSLVGAVREELGLEMVHLIFRLDRETSGLVVMAKNPAMGRRLQIAAQDRRYEKTYFAILSGALTDDVRVDGRLGPDYESRVAIKSRVVDAPLGQPAATRFTPLSWNERFTLARVHTETGRKHQIRAHAQSIGHSLVGDKIYGPDDELFLEFVETGWTEALAERLLLPRHALHCAGVDLRLAGLPHVFTASLPSDLRDFCRTRALFIPESIV